MDKGQIERILSNYREMVGRKASLEISIRETEQQFQKAMDSMLEDEVLASAENDGQPRGSGVHSQVESIAVRYADGYVPPDVRQMHDHLNKMIVERATCTRLIAYVEGWMRALNEKQRFVIQHQVIDGDSWREVVRSYRRHFQDAEDASKDRLKYMKSKAIDTIYNMAGGKDAPDAV